MRKRIIEFDGRSLSLKEWGNELGINADAVRYRLKYMPIEQALTRKPFQYKSGHIKGEPRLGLRGYMVIGNGDLERAEHVLIAEKAIGKPLPKGAMVHHVDENRINNSPSNLVICPNQAYHKLLHLRMDALKACGNPSYRRCRFCRIYDAPENMKENKDSQFHHRECRNKRDRDNRASLK